MTSKGSPRPEQAGQSMDPGESASRGARDRYSRVTAEAQVGNTEDSRDTHGVRPGLRAVQALHLEDLLLQRQKLGLKLQALELMSSL